MPHLGNAAHARADLQSERESVHARLDWLRADGRNAAAPLTTHHQEPAACGLKDSDAERLRQGAVQEDPPAHEHVPHLLSRPTYPACLPRGGRLATDNAQRALRCADGA